MRRASLVAVIAGFGLLLAGCGAHTASVQVGVADESGQPLVGALVWVDGGSQKATTDSTGNATLKGLKAGIYQVEAGTHGYFRQRQSVTIDSHSGPAPISIALPFTPPLGTFVWQPKSTEWVALSITNYNPFQAVLNIYEWGCFGNGWDQHAPQQVQLDPANNRLSFGYGSTIEIVGPDKLNDAWTPSIGGSGLPDTGVNVQPDGACNGDVAAWDNGNSP